jgi:glyoxylase-like metal-dependent hydrolase (beta-lactamase superfamily II)
MSSAKNKPCWIALVAVAATALVAPARADEFGPAAVPAGAQGFKIGALQATALHDAQFVVPNDGKLFGVDSGPAAVGELLKANQLAEDRITLSVNALLVRSGTKVILFDSGLGPKAGGSLMSSLAAAGVTPGEVTDVLITHVHGDHVGGLADSGRLAFPNAVIRMSSAEWAWMKSQSSAAELVNVLDGHVETFTPGMPVVPGVRSIALNGHTPGHVGYEISSGTQKLLDIGDLAHSSVISLQRGDWTMQFDNDSATAKATRKATFARLAKTHELLFAPHFPFPGVGRIVAAGTAYSWVPELP